MKLLGYALVGLGCVDFIAALAGIDIYTSLVGVSLSGFADDYSALVALVCGGLVLVATSLFGIGSDEESQLSEPEEFPGYHLFRDHKFDAFIEFASPLAEAGDANLAYHIGLIYYDGFVGDQDLDKAIYWWEKSLAQDLDGTNSRYLGDAYFERQRGRDDMLSALKFYEYSIPRETFAERNELAIERRDELRQQLTAAEIAEAEQMAHELSNDD